jgi:hypothetical protein
LVLAVTQNFFFFGERSSVLTDTVEKLGIVLIKKKLDKTDLTESPVLNDLLQGNAI